MRSHSVHGVMADVTNTLPRHHDGAPPLQPEATSAQEAMELEVLDLLDITPAPRQTTTPFPTVHVSRYVSQFFRAPCRSARCHSGVVC